MTVQTCIVLALALLCVLYFLKDLLRSALSGGCGSGCGSCKSGCPVKKLEAIQHAPDNPHQSA
jgi:epoxyqueuosine reductase QueG